MRSEYRPPLQIRQVETGQYLAISDDLPGLMTQGRTLSETTEISRDVARQLFESWRRHGDPLPKDLHPMHKAGMEFTIPEVA